MNDRTKNAVGRSASPAVRRAAASSAQEFARGVIAELRRVTWPSREEWMTATALTILLVVGIGLYVFVADWLFGQLFNLVHPIAG